MGPEIDATRSAEGCAVIFGGSGGIGWAAAQLLLSQRRDVLITYHRGSALAERLVAQASAAGGAISAVQCDVTERASVDAVIAAAIARHGALDTVISAQGTEPWIGDLAGADTDELRNKLNLDLIGYLNIVQAALPALRGRGGAITCVVSPGLERTVPGYGMGVVPKAAVAMAMRYFAREEGCHGVRFNAIGPGVIDTGMAIPLQQGAAETVLANVVAATPLGRLGRAEEVAELLVFLASRRAAYVTGQLVMIDGGFSL